MDTWCAWGVMKIVTGLGQEGQCLFGFLQGEARYFVMLMIISWESQGS